MDWQKWFEDLWTDREERVYRALFGDLGPGIYNLSPQVFASLGVNDPDPRFLFHGVFESPPNPLHSDWLYVSSGMSNPWGQSPETVDPNGYSGLGFELTLHTKDRAAWAIKTLHWLMAVQLLVACERLKGELLQVNDRIPVARSGNLSHLLVTSPEAPGLSPETANTLYPGGFSLASGKVDILLLVGILSREQDFANSQGVEGLITLLRHRNIWPLTDPTRISVV